MLRTILIGSVLVAKAICLDNRSVVVHCSDGWDRTAQVVALAELMMDPFYRTIEGLRVLIEREWVFYGHQFQTRLGAWARCNCVRACSRLFCARSKVQFQRSTNVT